MDYLRGRASRITRGIVGPNIRRGNLLLAAVPSAERRKLVSRCEPVELTLGDTLCEQGERISHVYFPMHGVIAQLASLDERSSLEVGLVGAEGMLGYSLMLGVTIAPGRALVQHAGSALRLDAAQFSRELKQSPELERTLKRYLYVVMSQLTQTAVCTHFHVIQARLARCLLTMRDRANSDEFRLTHEVTAYMLGVRRVGVTVAAIELQKRSLIRYQRGNVTVLDGAALEAIACICYAATTQIYVRIMR